MTKETKREWFKRQKQEVRTFMQKHYTDERLAQLLAHARDGKLAFYSCCCFIGIPTADHALCGRTTTTAGPFAERHLAAARLSLSRAEEAEKAFRMLWQSTTSGVLDTDDTDAVRRRILIPMVRTEMKRRENLRKKTEVAAEQYVTA